MSDGDKGCLGMAFLIMVAGIVWIAINMENLANNVKRLAIAVENNKHE